MDPFSATVLAQLTADLTGGVVSSLSGALKRQLSGTPEQQALERSIRAGIVALVAQTTAATATPEEEDLLADIFEKFFHHPVVWVAISQLIGGTPLDHAQLRGLFTDPDDPDTGYDLERLQSVDFDAALDAFTAAFVESVRRQKDLAHIVQSGLLGQLVRGQGESTQQIRELVARIDQLTSVAVRAGNVVDGASGQVGKYIAADEVHGPKFEQSGDFRGATIHIVTQYLGAPGDSLRNEDDFSDSLHTYLTVIKERYAKPELRGNIEVDDREPKNILLEKMYYSLAALARPEAREDFVTEPDDRSGQSLPREPKEPINMATLLRDNDRLVITGSPGSGKSTYLYLIASAVARALLGEGSELVEKYVGLGAPLPLPIFISLGEFNEYKKGPADPNDPHHGTLLAYASEKANKMYESFVPKDFFRRLVVGNKTCMFLLDGLDEIADETERELVSDEIRALSRNPKIGPIVVTCRSWAYVRETRLNAPFAEYEIQPMQPDQVDELVRLWCSAAFPQLYAQKASDDLISEIRDLESKRRERHEKPLADTPLMVTIIAIVFYNDEHLPNQRAALYKRCVRVLLIEKQRPAGRGKHARIAKGGSEEDKLELLSLLAYNMMTTVVQDDSRPGRGSERLADRRAEEKDIHRWLSALIDDRLPEGRPADHLRAFLRSMVDHAGILDERPKTPGRDRTYEFVHLSFQEYLCAAYLAGQPPQQVVDFLLENRYVSQSWWRETILLMPGHLNAVDNRPGALELIRRLGSGARHDMSSLNAAELAAGAYLELGFKAASDRATLAGNLVTLLTDPDLKCANQERAAAGVALGRLGDPRTDVNCDIPATVLIPAGPFRMGSDKRDKKSPWYDKMAYDDEEPSHEVDWLDFDYRIGKYPVTVAQYRHFVEAGGYDPRKSAQYWPGGGLKWLRESGQKAPRYWDDPQWTVDNHPVVGVTWYEAVAYCNWLNAIKPAGCGVFRLPDEAMWEKAARGTDGRRWPWGNEWDATKLNSREGGINRTSAVGIFPAGRRRINEGRKSEAAEFIYDCAGNVWEWCSGSGIGDAPYPFKRRSYKEDLELAPTSRALRGGSWNFGDQLSRAAFRLYDDPDYRLNLIGFRVVELLSDSDS
ncbi:MAG: SUMF1/EgtB/PvdO family nonheme iron enzyme [Candidatus Promineofilum sp.]|nr:SUMF1/EgtB/PvdO family nonheme iron enzyme [Promineifilum sp.]